MYTEAEQHSLDLDWYFTNGIEIGFVASGGGQLPASIANGESSDFLADYFRTRPKITAITINPELAKIIGSPADERYLEYFVHFAERGLYAFDKSKLNDFSNKSYHWVAQPIRPLQLDELPTNIAETLVKTKTIGNIKQDMDLTDIS